MKGRKRFYTAMKSNRLAWLLVLLQTLVGVCFYLGNFSSWQRVVCPAAVTPLLKGNTDTNVNKVRSLTNMESKFSSFVTPIVNSKTTFEHSGKHCKQWAVLTTIFKPSEAVRRQVRLKDWCLVVVGDRLSPSEYMAEWVGGDGNDVVVYLNAEAQQAMNSRFVDTLPWNHFGRKNIGYLYAVMHGASVIWDFDDDNMLKFWVDGAAPLGSPSLSNEIPQESAPHVNARTLLNHSYPTYNPYPVLGAPTLPSWPRGLPLTDIKNPECYTAALKNITVRKESIAVLQSLADYQPDVDAIFRLAMPIPFSFNRLSETKPLIIPTGVLTPYNAQATLHYRNSFWALLLPVSVHGRVSDIWRSYIAQRLFWDSGLVFGFMARPLVVQDRNPHNLIEDMNYENDLYMKSESLVKFLGGWKGNGATLVERIEELWIALYEHGYIELTDVELMQVWIQTLLDIGYQFPDIIESDFTTPLYPNRLVPKESVEAEALEEGCETSPPLTFWTSDLHDGSRIDVPSMLSTLGHKTIISGTKNSSPYPFVFEMEGVSQYLSRRSEVIKNTYTSHNTKLTEQMVQKNFEFYKDDDHIASVDAFFCEFPASMCELWMPFNKTIIFLPAHRYNIGRCTEEEWNRLNDHIYALNAMDKPNHFIAAKSIYDREYLRHYTGLDPLPLYSFGGFYTANNPFNPIRDEILLFGHGVSVYESKVRNLKVAKDVYPHYSLSDLMKHRAVVYITYSVMSYKLTELYSLGIPLFIPSMIFYRNIRHFGVDRTSVSTYCKNRTLDGGMKAHSSSLHPYSPNIEAEDDAESEYYWLQFADFYQLPHITYFDDFPELEKKLQTADFERIHNLMMAENERRKEELVNNWCKVIRKISTGQRVPESYSKAIHELYGVDRLQVY